MHWTARLGVQALSILSLLALWQAGSLLSGDDTLPGPGPTVARFLEDIASGELPYHVGITLGRVAAAFILAMAIGASVGMAMGLWRRADRFFDSWLILFLNMPALVVIVLCYLWFGLNEVAAIAAVAINKIPNVAVTLREGTRALDPKLMEMARVYRLPWHRTLRRVILPQLAPYYAAAARSGLALIWKIVLVVELLGRSNGVGFQIHLFFQLFDVASILAYSLAFIIIIQFIELGVLSPLHRRANRWRE